MPVRMTKEGRAETREDKRSEQANQQAMSAQAASNPSEDKGSTKAKEPKSPTERKNEKKAQVREARMTSTAKRYGERYTPGMLTGGQAKIAAKAPPPNKIDAKDLAVLRAEKAKGRGMGLQDESKKPGKIYKAALGLAFMKKAKDKGAKGAEFLSPIAMAKRMFNKKAGGVMKYKRGSGLDLPVISSVKPTVNKSKRAQNLSKMKIQFNKQRSRAGINPNLAKNFIKNVGVFPKVSGPKKYSSMAEMRASKGFKPGESASQFNKRKTALSVAKKAASATTVGKIALGVATAGVAAQQYLKGKMKDKKAKATKKMGGGMMQRPMGYNTGGPSAGFKSKQDRKKAEKNIKQARSKEGLRSFLSSGNKINQPMRKERYMEGRKARHTEFKKKIGKTALSIASSLNPVTSIAKGIGKVMGKGSKKRDFQKGDYGDISVKKNMGGMMMQRPMGYKHGTSVTAKCKLGRNKATKIT